MVGSLVPTPVDVQHLSKHFSRLRAVDDLSFHVEPGRVTGFLGPNGSGKTTTLRMLLGLIRPTAGTATIGGATYTSIRRPMTVVGAALEATNFHPGRSGRDHLRALAAASGIPDRRVDEMLEVVGIPAAARKRAGAYSMGMRQRLSLAGALLGNPSVVICDEPANGLDPEGIRWLRTLLRGLAAEGRTVLVSSHMLSEMQLIADDVVIIANGQLVKQGPIHRLEGNQRAYVRTGDLDRLQEALREAGMLASPSDGGLEVLTSELSRIGDVALTAGVSIHELRLIGTDLEQLFLDLTSAPQHRNRNLGQYGPPPGPPIPPPAGAPIQPGGEVR